MPGAKTREHNYAQNTEQKATQKAAQKAAHNATQTTAIDPRAFMSEFAHLFFSRDTLSTSFRALLKMCHGTQDPICSVALMLLKNPLNLCLCEQGVVPFESVDFVACIPYEFMSAPQLQFLSSVAQHMKTTHEYAGWSSMQTTFSALHFNTVVVSASSSQESMSTTPAEQTQTFADPIAVVAESIRITRQHYKQLGFKSAETAQLFILRRICANVCLPPQVLALASEIVASQSSDKQDSSAC